MVPLLFPGPPLLSINTGAKLRGGERNPVNQDRELAAVIDAALLEILLAAVPFGFAFLDPALCCVRVNTPLSVLDGRAVEAHPGRAFGEVMPGLFGDVAADLRRVLETGQPFLNREIDDGTRRCRVSGYPVRDGNGAILGVGVVVAEQIERQEIEFVREVLACVTDGRLLLCDSTGDLPTPLPALGEPVFLSSTEALGTLRARVGEAAVRLGFSEDRWREFLLAVGEAAMNALIHGGEINVAGGTEARIHGDGASGRLQVWVRDRGAGIALDRLHRATLERGYTTAGSLGNGFPIMIQTAERTYLMTGAMGTTVILEQGRFAPDPAWLEDRDLLTPFAH